MLKVFRRIDSIRTPVLGYDLVSSLVKESLATGRTLREIILQKRLLSDEQFDKIRKDL